MLRVLLALGLLTVVVVATASVAVRLVSDHPIPSGTRVTGLAWAGRVFTSEREFAAFLASRGVSYDVWAARHPGAAPWMQVRASTSPSSAGVRAAAPKPAPAENGTEARPAPPATPPSDAAPGEGAAAGEPAPAETPIRATPARSAARAVAAPPARRSERRDDIGAPRALRSPAAAADAAPRAVAAGGTSTPGGTSPPEGALALEATPISPAEAGNPSLLGGFVVAALVLAMMTMIVLVVRFLRGTWNP